MRYVGYTARLEQRRIAHRSRHPDWRLLVLGAYSSREIGLDNERFWIRRLWEAGHPLANVAEGGCGSIAGREISYLTRAKISAAMKGKRLSPETLAKRSAAMKGKRHSPETRARISAANMGKHPSRETRAKLSAAAKGKHFSAETRARMAAAKRGKPWSIARWAAHDPLKLSAAIKGRIVSPETRIKISTTLKRRASERRKSGK